MIQTAADWTPWENRYGEHFTIFTNEQEKHLEALIIRNCVDKQRLPTNEDFREIVIEFWRQIASVQGLVEAGMNEISQHLKPSDDISSRRSRFKRRSDTDVVLTSHWVTHTTNDLAEKPGERIINCDETCWLVFPDNILIWLPD
jgi:hypothetical protein